MAKRSSDAVKFPGGKAYLSTRIIATFPKHMTYCEPYAGGLKVLCAKDPEGISEVANDVNGVITAFWRVLQSETLFPRFLRRVSMTPFSESEFREAVAAITKHGGRIDGEAGEPSIDLAVAFFISCRQSLGARGEALSPLSKTRVRRGMNEQVSAWLSGVEGLAEVHERVKRVFVYNREATDVMQIVDTDDTLHYLDPTYLPETRTSPKVYQCEMTYEQHEAMLDVIVGLRGHVALSGYRNVLYDDKLKKWNRHDFEIPNAAAGGKTKRIMTESLWTNY